MSSTRSKSAVLLIAIAIACTPLRAGDWHIRQSSGCSDCHTQHNSENNQPMRTDNVSTPAPLLLRRGTPIELCVSCHDGSNPAAPDVITPVSYVAESAAGPFPNTGGTPTAVAHHLNNPTAEVPPGGSVAMVVVCTTCHDPHGNDNYRNLRPDPTQTNLAPISVLSSQTVIANGSNPSAVYVAPNVIYKSGVSKWCSTCHTDYYTNGHSVDTAIWGSAFASYTTWAAVTLPRVPVNSPADNVIPSNDDQVMCLSCHKAHGGNNPNTLIYADGATLDSTCQECHDQ